MDRRGDEAGERAVDVTLDWTDRNSVEFTDLLREADSRAGKPGAGDVTINVSGRVWVGLVADLNALRRMQKPPGCGRCGAACQNCAAEPPPPSYTDSEITFQGEHRLTIRRVVS